MSRFDAPVPFDYHHMVQNALRDVIRQALDEAATQGMIGDHHFYITFHTQAPGVDIPPFLSDLHPETMTIALQHQFWDLEAEREAFSVTLAFNRARHRITVPYTAVITFADPSAPFGLSFEAQDEDAEGDGAPHAGEKPDDEAVASKEGEDGVQPDSRKVADVVSLDQFRRKGGPRETDES